MLLPEDYKFLRKVILHDLGAQSSRIAELKVNLLESNPSLLLKAHLIAPVFNYTKHPLQISLETDLVGTSFAHWGETHGHKTLLSMVERLESDTRGMIVRAVLPYGVGNYPCEMLMLRGNFGQNKIVG